MFLLVLFFFFSPAAVQAASGTHRIISLVPSQTEMLFELGFGDQVVGVSDFCNFPEAVLSLPKAGGLELNLERIVALRPSVLIDLGGMHRRYAMFFHQVGLRYVDISIRSFSEIPTGAIELARALGQEKRGQDFAQHWDQTLRDLLPKKPRGIRTYVEIWDTPIQAAGPASFLGEMITLAGGVNILPSSPIDFPVISSEQIIRGDPDLILVAYPISDLNHVRRRSGWSDIKAVRNNQVFSLDYDLFVRPGPRCLEAFRKLTGYFNQVPR